MKLTHTWKTKSGKNIVATSELILKETVFADGGNVEIEVSKQTFKIEVEGMGVVGNYIKREKQTMAGVVYPATCGKLVISQTNLDAIDSMMAEIESHPAWIANKKKETKRLEEEKEYAIHTARIKKAMRE